MYLDPPYYHADQKRAYTKSFEEKDHRRLAKALSKTGFLFCLSYDDCEEVKRVVFMGYTSMKSNGFTTQQIKKARAET